MPTTFGRIRRRVNLLPKAGTSVKQGYFNTANTTNGTPNGSYSPFKFTEQTFNYNAPWLTAQVTGDEVHSGPPYVTGGPFSTLRITYMTPFDVQGRGVYVRSDRFQRYVGGFTCPASSRFGGPSLDDLNLLLNMSSPIFPSMEGWGSKAWAKAKPQLERASAFVFFAEFKDTPRMLKTSSREFHDIWNTLADPLKKADWAKAAAWKMRPKRAADSFLNQQFGWKPFLGDLQKFHEVYLNTTKLMTDFTDRNDKWTRRKVTLMHETTSTKVDGGTGCIISPQMTVPNGYCVSNPTWELYVDKETTISAVGRFKYYRPEFDTRLTEYNSAWMAMQRRMTMYGLRVSPANIYRATPWTWALDWVSSVGEHVSYLNDILVDSVQAKYLYLVQTQVEKRKIRQVLPTTAGPVTLEWTRVIETKQRQEAGSPLDFNLTWDQLTPRQLAIAGALGISRKK